MAPCGRQVVCRERCVSGEKRAGPYIFISMPTPTLSWLWLSAQMGECLRVAVWIALSSYGTWKHVAVELTPVMLCSGWTGRMSLRRWHFLLMEACSLALD